MVSYPLVTPPITGGTLDQRAIDLFDEYTHTGLERSAFLKRLAVLTGGVVAAQALLPLLEVNYLHAQVVPKRDERIHSGRVTFEGADGPVQGYLARPNDDKKHAGVMVIHENRGLNPHIEDVARRAALAGFVALAPDALSSMGGTPDDSDKARSMIYQLDSETTRANFVAAAAHLRQHPHCTGKVGCVGFCWGGGMANQLAVRDPQMLAAVAFYGQQADARDAGRIKGALLLHYAGLDRRINAGIAAYEEALKAAGVDYTLHMYDGVNHAFHNDTAPTRYDKAAATLAWERTMAFFEAQLR